MSRRKKQHRNDLPAALEAYAKSRTLEFHRYSEYHMRIIDQDFTVLDVWTTGKYYCLQTEYFKQTDKPILERGGEQGWLPATDKLNEWLDKFFYAADMLEG